MKLISLLTNIWSIDELKKKIFYTLLFTGIYIFLSYVIMPGLVIQENIREFQYIAIAPFGLLPYVYSTVLVGLFTQNERKFKIYSWVIALVITILQEPAIFSWLVYLNLLSPGMNLFLYLFMSLIGTSVCIYIAEKITEKGICNGRDLLMGVSVIVFLPKTFASQFLERLDNHQLLFFVLDLMLMLLPLGIAIFISQALVRVPIKTSTEEDTGNTVETNTHILIKLNSVADYPINFAIAIQLISLTVLNFFMDTSKALLFSDLTQSLVLFAITFLSTFLYTARCITPETIKKQFLALTASFRIDVEDQPLLEKNVVVKEEFYERLLLKATFVNACCLGLMAILPIILPKLGISINLAGLISSASIIFVVNSVFGALYNIDEYLYQFDFETIEAINGASLIGKEVFYLPEDTE